MSTCQHRDPDVKGLDTKRGKIVERRIWCDRCGQTLMLAKRENGEPFEVVMQPTGKPKKKRT